MSLLDIDEKIIEIAEMVDIRATPITDLKEPEQGVSVGILTGAVNLSTNEEIAKKMRARCSTLVALGDCAVFGGIPAERNLCGLHEALNRAYVEIESNDNSRKVPSHPELGTPITVRALNEVVEVDVFIPGCPPHPETIYYALTELVQGRKPVLQSDLLHWD
jgi:NAD-reducing hydrogenase small subunit